MSSPESFRTSVQPFVRSAVERGATVAQITGELRAVYGHAYRRSDLLADMRAYRGIAASTSNAAVAAASVAASVAIASTSTAIASAMSGYRDLRALLARVGVAAFSISLLLPTLVHGITPARVMVASSVDRPAVAAFVEERVSLPNVRPAPPTPAPTPDPTPVPTVRPTPVPPPQPVYATLPNGMTGVVVTASWYGPGFYENRLPCWQWLQANGLAIQYLPDTWGVAHKTLPCGTMLTLSHNSNVITVPVVDRGPYVAGRELDLAPKVKAALGCTDLCTVVMHIP